MQVIDELRELGLIIEIIDWPSLQQNRTEKTVIIKTPKRQCEKEEINSSIKYAADSIICNYTGIQYYLTQEERM